MNIKDQLATDFDANVLKEYRERSNRFNKSNKTKMFKLDCVTFGILDPKFKENVSKIFKKKQFDVRDYQLSIHFVEKNKKSRNFLKTQ